MNNVIIFEGQSTADINRQIAEWREQNADKHITSVCIAPPGQRSAAAVIFDKPEVVAMAPVVADDISLTLMSLGTPAHIKGFVFIKTAIELIRKDYTYLYGLTTRLYPTIAEMHNTTDSRVERAIRHGVELAWDANLKQFHNWADKPTNGEFLATLVEKLTLAKAG